MIYMGVFNVEHTQSNQQHIHLQERKEKTMKRTINECNVTKYDLINAETSDSFKSIVGLDDFKEVRACAIVEDVDRETGELKEFSYIFTADGNVYGGNSESIKRACDNVISLLQDGDRIKFKVKSAKTNNGREFLSLIVAPVE